MSGVTVCAVRVSFFGVRGSCPCAGEEYRRTGGNTSCVLVSLPGEPPLVLDLGTGLRALGDALETTTRRLGAPVQANALLTHLHFDHILGLPFFAPLQDPGARLAVFGPAQGELGLHKTLSEAVQPPFFPVEIAEFNGEVVATEVDDCDFELGAFSVRARRVPHPGATLGYRIEANGAAVAYLPDHQAPLDRREVPDAVMELCEGADLVVHDAQYTDEEFAAKPAWGHSTFAYAVRVAAECGARRLALFHHDPWHTDRDLVHILRRARRLPEAAKIPDLSLAAEGMTVEL